MSTSTLRELVEAIKTQGKTIASAGGASAATARDLVYLSTSVERLFGADAILELVDSAAKPVEVVSAALASTQAVDLTVDQVTKTVIKFTNTSGTHSASDFTATIPNQGVAFVVDNEMPVPVKFKTSTQTTNIVQIDAGKKGWVFCDGTVVEHVIDIEGITSALTSPTVNPGDMIYREGKANGTTEYYDVYVRDYGGQNYYYFTPHRGSGYNAMTPWNYDRTPNLILYPGVTYRFYQDHTSNTGHPIKFSTTQHGTHNSGTELTDINSDSTADITYSGTPGTATAYTQIIVPTTGTNVGTLYYYCPNHNLMGGTGVVTIPATTGVAKLPIGEAYTQLTVSSDGNKPEWRPAYFSGGANIGAIAPPNDFTGVWSDGRIRLATLVTNATDYPYAANKGTYMGSQGGMPQYRGSSMLYYANGRVYPSVWGSVAEGRSANHYNIASAYSGVAMSMSYGGGASSGIDGAVTEQRAYGDYEAKQILGGYYNTLVLLTDGSMWCCGDGAHGQIGDGAAADRYAMQKVNMPNAAGPVRYVAQTSRYPELHQTYVALTESGDVYCWGYNGHGQCGSNAGTAQTTPVKVTQLSNIEAIFAGGGGNHGMCGAIDVNGNCFTWGYNGYGQLGHGNTTSTATPTQVQPQSNVKVVKMTIEGSSSHTFTHWLMANGRVYGAGRNNYQQIGDGSSSDRNTPTLVANLGLETNKYVVDIFGCGGYIDSGHFYLTDNGDLYANGSNNRGMLGVGNTTAQSSPVLVQKVKYCSSVTSSGTTTSTSYRYNSFLFVGHNSFEDRAKRINGTVYSAGYTNPSMGSIGLSTNNSTPIPWMLDFGAGGKVRFAWSAGYHSSNTQEMCSFCIDMQGRVWGCGYSGGYATWGRVSDASYLPHIGT